jgi:hypothetical protein
MIFHFPHRLVCVGNQIDFSIILILVAFIQNEFVFNKGISIYISMYVSLLEYEGPRREQINIERLIR